MRRRDDPHVDRNRFLAAHPADRALFDDAEQTHLHRRGHVADFVEEQRPAIGLLEQTGARALGAGECAPRVAEKLGLQERLRDGRAVLAEERPAAPRAVHVDRTGDELLARAALAADHDR